MKVLELYKKTFSGLSVDVWKIALIYLVNRCGEMVIPFMSVYLTSQLGFTKGESGVTLLCFGLGAMIGSNVGGYLSDRIGNFKVMTLSLTGTGIGFICLIFFQSLFAISLWLALTAVFSSMFSPAAFSGVALWGKPENKTRGFSLLRMAINLGVAIGPALGGFMAFYIGYKALFVFDGMTCFIAVMVLQFVLAHRKEKTARPVDLVVSKMSPYRDWVVLLFLFFNLLNMIAFFQILFSVPVYFKEEILMNEKLIGAFFTLNGLLVFALEMPLVYIIEKKNKFFKPLVTGAILIGLGYASLSLFDNPLVAILLYSVLVALGEVINFPLIPSLVMRRADDQNQGKYMGVVSMMFAMAFALAPVSGLPIVERIGYHTYWNVAAAMSILSGLCLWMLKGHFEKTSPT